MISIITFYYGHKKTDIEVVDCLKSPNRTLKRLYSSVSRSSKNRMDMFAKTQTFVAGASIRYTSFVIERDDKTVDRRGVYKDYSLISDDIPF